MPTASPFLTVKVECPICKTVNEFESVRVGAYTEEKRDTDFCPINIKWRFPRYQGYNPLLYFTATCTNCLYSRELNNQFKDWKEDNNFKVYRLKSIKEKHLEQLSEADSPLKQMGEQINPSRYPNESAILKLLLAVYDEQLSERPHALDLGRFYLRIGWVFRDMTHGEDPTTQVLKGILQELDGAYTAVTAGIANVEEELDKFSTVVDSHFDARQLSADIKAQMLQHKDGYDQHLENLRNQLSSLENFARDLRQHMTDYRTALLGGVDGDAAAGFGNHPSFESFLESLKTQWSGVVATEHEALSQAVRYYKEAFANGRDIAPGNQQIQASYLIAELSRRIGDVDTARQYFASTIRSGQEFIYQHRNEESRTVLARKIMELAIEQGRANLAQAKPA